VGEEGGCSGGPGGEAEAKKCESQAELSPLDQTQNSRNLMTSDIQVITREKQISFLPAATKRKEVSFVLLFCFVIRFRFFHQASFFSFLLLAHMNNSSSEKGGVTISSLPASKYISSANIRKVFSVSYPTLRKWAKERKVGFVRLPGGSRLHDAAGID